MAIIILAVMECHNMILELEMPRISLIYSAERKSSTLTSFHEHNVEGVRSFENLQVQRNSETAK